MKWKVSLPKPEILVYYFPKLIGLAPFTLDVNGFRPLTMLGKLYSIFVATSYFFVAMKTTNFLFDSIRSANIPQVARIGLVTELFVGIPSTFSIIVIFLLMHEKVLYVMNKLQGISNELKRLGIEENRELFFKNTLVTILKTNTLLAAACVTLHFTITYYVPTSVEIKYVTENLVYVNTVIIFGEILNFIRQRFRLLNEKLFDVFGPAAQRRSLHHSRIFSVSRNPPVENRAEIQDLGEDLTDLQRLRKVEALYLELSDLVDRTTQLFAIPILLKTCQFCADLILNNFWFYYGVRNFSRFYDDAGIVSFLRNISDNLLRMTIVIVQFLAVVRASVKTCEEGNAMRAVLFRVWYKFKPRVLADEFFMFSLQLLHKPVIVSAFGLFDLDYSFLYQMFGAVLTFVIIMIQFDTTKPHFGT